MEFFGLQNLAVIVDNLPPVTTFFMDTFFTKRHLNPTIFVDAEFRKGTRRMAPFISGKTSQGVTRKLGYRTEHFETPLISEKDVTTVEQLMKKGFGESVDSAKTPAQRGTEMTAETLMEFKNSIIRKTEYMCAKALLDGEIHVLGEDVDYTIDFGFSNDITLTEGWDDPDSDADPIVNLTSAHAQVLQNGYTKPDVCVMNSTTYASFLAKVKDLGYLGNDYLKDLIIEPKIKNDYVVRVGYIASIGLEIYTYDTWYLDDFSSSTATEKAMIENGDVLLATTKADYSIEYGAITLVDDTTKQFYTVEEFIASMSYVSYEPIQRMLKLMSRPLPMPTKVDSWAVLHTFTED